MPDSYLVYMLGKHHMFLHKDCTNMPVVHTPLDPQTLGKPHMLLNKGDTNMTGVHMPLELSTAGKVYMADCLNFTHNQVNLTCISTG